MKVWLVIPLNYIFMSKLTVEKELLCLNKFPLENLLKLISV